MAYTKAPTQDTYSSLQVDLSHHLRIRPGVDLYNGPIPDERLVNFIPKKDKEQKETRIETRPPITAKAVATSGVPRGCYAWEKTAGTVYYFTVFGTKIYTSTDALTWTNVTTFLTNATTPVGFTEFINDTNTKSLIIVDGVEGYIFTSNAAGTKITDVDFPSPHQPFPIFLDGYLFLAKSGTGDIYNSDLNHPENWTAGSFISSEVYPDDIQALAKINNYILALGTEGAEFFYDAANATGTPLARYDAGLQAFGCEAPYSMAANKDTIIFLSNNSDGEMTLKVIEDFKNTEIPAGVVTQTINQCLQNGLVLGNIRGFFMRISGEQMYVLNLDGTGTQNYPCFAYVFSSGTWIVLSSSSSTTKFGYFAVTGATAATTLNVISFVQGCDYVSANPVGFFGKIQNIAGQTADDNLNTAGVNNISPIVAYVILPPQDFGTMNRKFMSRLGIRVELDGYDASESIQVYWTDDDFKTWQGPVSLYLADGSGNYLDFPFITQLGVFRKRAFKLVYSGNHYLSATQIEVDINKGQQ